MKTLCNPFQSKLLKNRVTIGEKLKDRRLELKLLQKDVAKALGVCEDSITLWENNRSVPSVTYYPKIIDFLGYVPFDIDSSSLGGKMRLYRYMHGLTQEKLADKLEINESTIFHYEKNKHRPSTKILKKFKFLL